MAPLRGRDSEYAELGRLVAAAADGAGGVAIVEGAAGIGKSRLLAEAAQIAASQGVQVAAGVCDELDQVTPWAPLLQGLSTTSPILASEVDLAPLRDLADQRLPVIERIRGALERASQRRPLLITVDDLQWADPATLLALGSLPAQLFSFPVAWILAQRPLPVSPRRQSLTARLAEAGAVLLHLKPLDDKAAAAMAADVLGTRQDATVADLLTRAEGNPFYISQLLRGAAGPALPPTGAEPERSSPDQLPASLRSAVAAHLRSLPEPARDLLKVASVLGREFTVSELATMTGQPVSELMAPLEQALTAEVLTERADPPGPGRSHRPSGESPGSRGPARRRAGGHGFDPGRGRTVPDLRDRRGRSRPARPGSDRARRPAPAASGGHDRRPARMGRAGR